MQLRPRRLVQSFVSPWLAQLLSSQMAAQAAGRVLYLGRASDLGVLRLPSAIALAEKQDIGGLRARPVALPFADASFDLVVRAGLWQRDGAALAAEAGRVLRHGGYFLLALPVRDRLAGRLAHGVLRAGLPHAHELTRLFMMAGFVEVSQVWAPSPLPAVATVGRWRRLQG